MSHRIIDILCDYADSNKRPIMIIASRNQIDKNTGYVMTTEELGRRGKRSQYIKVCRDHCGPYFLDSEKGLGLAQALSATTQTIEEDIKNHFDLIHIDTSRCQDPFKVADKLLRFCTDLRSDIEFEFGTEENVGIETTVDNYQQSVDFAKNYKNIKFVVAQTGSLVMEDRQAGHTSLDVLKRLVEVAEKNNVGLKEHNADYLTADQILMRKVTGVHAMNIAPQLGVIETKTVLELANKYQVNSNHFKDLVLKGGRWKKWIIEENDMTKISVAGHYHFNSLQYKNLNEQLHKFVDVDQEVAKSINAVLDLYFNNFS